jgi:feruloyl esterase
MMKKRFFGACILMIGLISIFVFTGCVPVTPGNDLTSCGDLKRLSLYDEALSKNITFDSSKFRRATASLPDHCEIKGRIWPEIDFIIKLPKNWNQKFIYFGGGGIDGSAMAFQMAPGLNDGYAAAVSNGGHNGNMTDASFAYDVTDDGNGAQRLKDFGYRAHHETPVLAKKLIKAHYGSAPTYSYWVGCSNGGREGMMEAQRYPDDFDGYVIGAPVLDYTGTTIRGVWNGWVQQGAAALSIDQMPYLGNAVYAKCDGYDGLIDGLIDDSRSCDFNPGVDVNVCAESSPTCFTRDQIEALKKIYEGPVNSQGEQLFPGTPFGAEMDGILGGQNGWRISILPFKSGTMADPLAASFMMYASFDPDPGPEWDYTTYDFDVDPGRTAALGVPEIVNAVDPNLLPVKTKGAKIIHYHGWIDTVITPFMSINYYEAVMGMLGKESTQDFYKLYMIPGMHHCTGGAGCGRADWLTPLVNWVEKGIAPESIIGLSTDGTITRPLCPYPQVARYNGNGSTDKAENFACVSLP